MDRIAEAQPQRTRKGYYIYLTEACNLRCDYCFVREKQNHRHMSEDMAGRVLSFIQRDAAPLKEIYVHFFGGEPMIRADLVDYFSQGLRNWSTTSETTIRLGITTNGTLLSEANCDLLARHGIGVQLSLDGSQAGNDVHRRVMGRADAGDSSRFGAYKLVQIDRYMQRFGKQQPNCRMTLTVQNLPFLMKSVEELHERGFLSFSIIPDFESDQWSPEALKVYQSEMAKVFEYWARNQSISINTVEHTIQKLLRKREASQSCAAGEGLLGITVDGDLYPCHDFAGRYAAETAHRERLLLGNVETGFLTDRPRGISTRFTNEMRSPNGHDCATCRARWVCGRGCPFMNYAHGPECRTVNGTYCETARINSTLALQWMSVLDGFRFVDGKRAPQRRPRAEHVAGEEGNERRCGCRTHDTTGEAAGQDQDTILGALV